MALVKPLCTASERQKCCGIFCRRAYVVAAGHILSPATIYADAHGTYCWQSSEPKLKLRDDDDNEDDDDDDDDDIMMIIIIFIETC